VTTGGDGGACEGFGRSYEVRRMITPMEPFKMYALAGRVSFSHAPGCRPCIECTWYSIQLSVVCLRSCGQ
jgi:hypothetical protein